MGKQRGPKRASSGNRGASVDTSPTKHSRRSTNQQVQEKVKKLPTAGKASLSAEDETSTKPQENSTNNLGQLDLTTPGNLLASLLAPAVSLATFFAEYWEKKPLVVHRGRDRTSASYYGVGFSRDGLLRLLAEHRIDFGQDINVCRYVESKRENLNGNGRATAVKIKNLFDQKKATLQFHQPQRFQDELWRICELLESYFHSLVGANVYMTPGGSQGLAPHYDDVEVLILQLEGRKHWRLYSPPVALPRDYSGDLDQDVIGQPTHNFVLETGDFLYFPRGTVHQADTPADCPYSAHVTISTYQRSSYGDLLSLALPGILNDAIHGSLDFRKGLATDFLACNGQGDKSIFKHLMGHLSNHVGDHIQQAANQMMCDFLANRLPPYRADGLQAGSVGPMPTDNCKVRLAYPRHTFVALVTDDADDAGDVMDEEDEEDEDGEREGDDEDAMAAVAVGNDGSNPSSVVLVRHSVMNSRTDHMMGTGEDKAKGLRFPVTHHQALIQLKESTDWLDSGNLDLPRVDTKNLLVSLWAEGLLQVSKE